MSLPSARTVTSFPGQYHDIPGVGPCPPAASEFWALRILAHKPLQLAIEDAVDVVCTTPDIGEMKTGDLSGIRVYKFRFNRQEYLVAYRPPEHESPVALLIIDFYYVGTHENFYDALKRYLKQGADRGGIL